MFWLFSQVLQWTKQRCLLLTSALLVQKGSASSTTSRPSVTKNNELTICLGGTVGVSASRFYDYWHTHHRCHYYARISLRNILGKRSTYWFSSQDFVPPPFFLLLLLLLLRLTLQDKPDFSNWSMSDIPMNKDHFWQCGSRRDTTPNISWQTNSVPYAMSYILIWENSKG